ncbi:MAG: lysophospholipid acyltransferase family protein [Heliobacteriaceae bacterium]|jgi:1-acyl-sn-glycerol-3-phosphate acyltransferase|nr:lysophospholipid acyltransferase family protein [Heliobacteriaceae bacterium]
MSEQLYSNVPPTKLRNKEETFKPSKTSKFWLTIASLFFFNMLQNRFFAFRYSGAENYHNRSSDYPTIIFAPHCNWWDGIVLYNITHRICRKEIRLMVEELNRFPLLRRGGAYSVNKKSPQTAMQALKYSVDLMADFRNLLCIFPQGIIRPPHYRPIEFQTGLAYIAQKAVQKYGKVNLIPLAIDYCFFRDNRPEVMVKFGKTIELTDPKTDRKKLTSELEKALQETCDNQFSDISQGNVSDYEILFKQHLKWYRRIEQRLKSIDLPPVSDV